MLTPTANAQRRNTRNLPGSPKHPRPIRIKVNSATPSPTVQLPKPPAFGAVSFKRVAQLSPAQRVSASADFVCAAAAAGAPASYVESRLKLPAGALTGYVLADRELLIRVCMAMHDFANTLDLEACRLSDSARTEKKDHVRITINQSNILRARAEGYRRTSESLMRKATAPQDRAEAKARAVFQRLWDELMGGSGSYLPHIEVTVTNPADRAGSARQILVQLQRDYDARIASGLKPIDLLQIRDQIRRLKMYLQRQVAPGSQVVQPAKAEAPMPTP